MTNLYQNSHNYQIYFFQTKIIVGANVGDVSHLFGAVRAIHLFTHRALTGSEVIGLTYPDNLNITRCYNFTELV